MTKNKIEQPIEEQYESIKDLDITEIIPNVIDGFVVSLYEDHHTIVLPMNTTGTMFKIWSRGRGGIFSKDVHKYSFNKPHGKYILIEKKDFKCIARLINDDEESTFKTFKLIDGKIKDRSYMILKTLGHKDKLATSEVTKNEKEEIEPIEVEVITTTPNVSAHDDDVNYNVGTVSLFDE